METGCIACAPSRTDSILSISSNRSVQDHEYEKYKEEYRIALAEFHEHRKCYERTVLDNKKCIAVDLLTARLQEPYEADKRYHHDLHRLLFTEHHSRSSQPPSMQLGDLMPYCRIFCILLSIGYPKLAELFEHKGLDDSKLPIDRATLAKEIEQRAIWKALGDDNYLTFYDQFCKEQYAWCPVVLDFHMRLPCHNEILPFYRKEKIQPYKDELVTDDVTLWKIDVLEEFISQNLRKKLDESLWRQHEAATGQVDDEGKVR